MTCPPVTVTPLSGLEASLTTDVQTTADNTVDSGHFGYSIPNHNRLGGKTLQRHHAKLGLPSKNCRMLYARMRQSSPQRIRTKQIFQS